MRSVIVVLLSLVGFCANGQQFEGTIKWAIKNEYPDSVQARKPKEGRKEFASAPPDSIQIAQTPDTLVTIIDDSIQVTMPSGAKKARQENRAQPGAMTGLSMKLKNGNLLLQPVGGGNEELLYLKSSRQWYVIEHKRKSVVPVRERDNNNSKNKSASEKAEFLKTSEVAKILGYKCVKYSKTYSTQKGRVITQEIWVTDEIKNLDLTSLAKQRLGRYRFPVDQVKGVPLKLVQFSNEGRFIVEATSLKKESVADKLVSLPAEYKEIKR